MIPSTNTHIHVLIVEDNILAAEMLQGMLEELAYDVVGIAVDGLQGIQMTQTLEPDLVVMDIELPGMDGLEAAQHIAEACPTPVIILTAYDVPALLEQASASGVGAYLTKPANPYDLQHAIVTTMARFDDMQALRRLNAQLQEEITERQRAEQALQKSETRYRTLIDNMPLGVCRAKANGEIVMANPAFLRMFGFPPEAALQSTTLANLFQEPDAMLPLHEALFSEGNVTGVAVSMRRRDGASIWASFTASVAHNNGEEEGERFVDYTIEDITERKASEQALAASFDQLERSNRELQNFASVLSRDLRDPLNMVVQSLTLLQERYAPQLDPNAQEYVGYAVDGTRHVQDRIEAILSLARVETQCRNVAEIDAGAVLKQVLVKLRGQIEQSGATVTHQQLPTLTANADQLGRVFQNLIDNALKYRGKQPPHIHVGAQKDEEGWQFSIKDNGPGIKRKDCERIFQIFERVHPRGDVPGLGIGLALCKKIVECHGGRIWIASEPGHGTTFHFTLPDR